jgi:type VI protein secretion system component VasK
MARPRTLLLLATLAGCALLAWAALTVVGVEPFDNEGPRVALIGALSLAALALAAGLARLLRRDAAARAEAARREEAVRREAAEAGEEADRAERRAAAAAEEAARQGREADEHRRSAVRAVAALERERHWSRELRSQVVEMHQARGALGPATTSRRSCCASRST